MVARKERRKRTLAEKEGGTGELTGRGMHMLIEGRRLVAGIQSTSRRGAGQVLHTRNSKTPFGDNFPNCLKREKRLCGERLFRQFV